MFDRSFLPSAQLEFVVVSDTHYMLDPGTRPVEFESRRLQTARAERVLRLIASLKASFVVHLGDLVQEFPETERFSQAMAEAREQLERCGVTCRHVAGNHDVGDKPDPTMPTDWVTPESLAAYHALYGRSWYSWDQAGVHCVVLNSQIMNTTLPEAGDQRRWLESDLAAHRGQRIFVFLHLAPFLKDAHEPALGHYDNIAEPARAWLLNLLRRHQVELLFAGHSHFAFFDRIGGTRYFIAASPTFTRPGFGEAFSSCPPAERGRNDAGKLGFYLVRVQDGGVSVHFIRTYGRTSLGDGAPRGRHVITRTSRDLPGSPLGVLLHHPLGQAAEVPIAWPSVIRQRVRNDYPLLACTELGLRHLRVPASDLDDRLQRRRLAVLRDEGVQITAAWLWSDRLDLAGAVARHRYELDGVELQLLGTPWPEEECLRQVRRCRDELGVPVTLSTAIPRECVPGKQHSRTRCGYRLPELVELNRRLSENRLEVDCVLCRVDPNANPWESIQGGLETGPLSHVRALDWIVGLPTTDEASQVVRAAEATFAAALLPGSRLFLEPLVDLDRTMDVSYGLLDRLCNPRRAFHVVRCLNTILFGSPETWRPATAPALDGARILGLIGPATAAWLLLPLPPRGRLSLDLRKLGGFGAGAREVRCFHLERGTSESLALTGDRTPFEFGFDEAIFLML